MALQKLDNLWFGTALSEQAESRVIQYLKKNHPEYQKMQAQTIKLVENNPALWKLTAMQSGS